MIDPLNPPVKDRFTIAMALVCLIGFGGFVAWAALAPLEEGVAAAGQMVVETDRQVVQHLEGGIIRDLNVKEGDLVVAGDVLVVLEDTAALARRDQVLQNLAALIATVSRLRALQSGADTVAFAVLDTWSLGDAERADIIERETSLFDQQRGSARADMAVLSARRDAALTTQSLRAQEIAFTEQALTAAQEELALARDLAAEQLARRDQVSGLQRSVATLESEIARLTSEREQAGAQARDLDGQIAQTEADFQRDVSAQLRDARADVLAAEESLSAAQDVLDRAVIRAPVSGQVLNLAFSTRGGVIRPGDTLLEIVPEVETLTASVRIRPADRASVYVGQPVRTRVLAYRSWRAPRLQGEIVTISADLKNDPQTGALYYDARIRIPHDEATKASELEITPGMPVEAFLFSGSSRTTLDYIFEPIAESMFRGFRTS